jgi:hypothetical protein
VGAREEAVVPAGSLVELAEEHEQLVRRGMDPCGDVGDGFAKLLDGSRLAVGKKWRRHAR